MGRPYSPLTREAARLLGARTRLGRLQRRWTLREMAERVGTTVVTLRRIERGEVNVSLGLAFEAAVLAGVPLFSEDPARVSLELERTRDRLAVLPRSVRARADDDAGF